MPGCLWSLMPATLYIIMTSSTTGLGNPAQRLMNTQNSSSLLFLRVRDIPASLPDVLHQHQEAPASASAVQPDSSCSPRCPKHTCPVESFRCSRYRTDTAPAAAYQQAVLYHSSSRATTTAGTPSQFCRSRRRSIDKLLSTLTRGMQ